MILALCLQQNIFLKITLWQRREKEEDVIKDSTLSFIQGRQKSRNDQGVVYD